MTSVWVHQSRMTWNALPDASQSSTAAFSRSVDDRVRVAHQKVPGVAIVDRQEAPEQPVERVLAGHHLNLRTCRRQLVAHRFLAQCHPRRNGRSNRDRATAERLGIGHSPIAVLPAITPQRKRDDIAAWDRHWKKPASLAGIGKALLAGRAGILQLQALLAVLRAPRRTASAGSRQRQAHRGC
jgi:hypothetical protein